jgi:TPR repeat protein
MRIQVLSVAALSLMALAPPLHSRDWWADATEALDGYDNVRAVAALRLAAASGNLRSQEVLALMLWHGEALYPGVSANRMEALEWFGTAARGGSDTALYLLRGWAQRGSDDAARTLAIIRP